MDHKQRSLGFGLEQLVVSGQLGLCLSSLSKSTDSYNYPRFLLFSSSCCNVHLHCPLCAYFNLAVSLCCFFSCGRKFSQLLARTSLRSRRQWTQVLLNLKTWSLRWIANRAAQHIPIVWAQYMYCKEVWYFVFLWQLCYNFRDPWVSICNF